MCRARTTSLITKVISGAAGISWKNVMLRSVWEVGADVGVMPEDNNAMCESVELVPQVHEWSVWEVGVKMSHCARGRNCRFLSKASYRDLCRLVKDAA